MQSGNARDAARPYILGALLDAAAHGLHMLPQLRLQQLPRMADFALWATACESAFRPAGSFKTAHSNNRRDARFGRSLSYHEAALPRKKETNTAVTGS